jgi:hypothetical protein
MSDSSSIRSKKKLNHLCLERFPVGPSWGAAETLLLTHLEVSDRANFDLC